MDSEHNIKPELTQMAFLYAICLAGIISFAALAIIYGALSFAHIGLVVIAGVCGICILTNNYRKTCANMRKLHGEKYLKISMP